MSIILEKKGDSHQIDLGKNSFDKQLLIKANLNWSQKSNRNAGLLSNFTRKKASDLDLGCMYEMMNGKKGVIQSLGDSFGAQERSPYIVLDQDDRTGASRYGENITIYRPEMIKRVLFLLGFTKVLMISNRLIAR